MEYDADTGRTSSMTAPYKRAPGRRRRTGTARARSSEGTARAIATSGRRPTTVSHRFGGGMLSDTW
jgi:hypothetical protein